MAKEVRPIPAFESEMEERRFWENRDSSDHVDWSKAERVRLPGLRPSTTSIWLGMSRACSSGSRRLPKERDVP